MAAIDTSTFEIRLSEPFGMVIDIIADQAGVAAYMLPERIAKTPVRRFLYMKLHTKVRQFLAQDKVVKSKLGKGIITALKKIKHKFFGVDLR